MKPNEALSKRLAFKFVQTFILFLQGFFITTVVFRCIIMFIFKLIWEILLLYPTMWIIVRIFIPNSAT